MEEYSDERDDERDDDMNPNEDGIWGTSGDVEMRKEFENSCGDHCRIATGYGEIITGIIQAVKEDSVYVLDKQGGRNFIRMDMVAYARIYNKKWKKHVRNHRGKNPNIENI